MGGKARQVAKVMALVSALSFGSSYSQESHAFEASRGTPRAERYVHSAEQRMPREERMSSVGRMFDRIADNAHRDMRKVKTAEDAELLLRAHYDEFVSEYYAPTRGNVRSRSYGTRAREYTIGDLHSIISNANDLKGILNELHQNYGVDHERRSAQMDDLIQKVERTASYSGQIKSSVIRQIEEQFGNIRIKIRPR